MIKDEVVQIWRYIKLNWIVCLIAVYALAMVIPPLPFMVQVYYLMLMSLFVYMISRPGIKVNTLAALFIAAAAVSIMIGSPPAVFKSWERLGLLILVIGAVFPLFQTSVGNYFYPKLLKVTLSLFVLVGVVSFFCYLLGINYMSLWDSETYTLNLVGKFGGITSHSMILGPLCAFGNIYLVCKIIYGNYSRALNIVLWVLVGLCTISTLLSASRAALICEIIGIVICIYLKYQGRIGKFIGKLTLAIIVLLVCFPLYSNYLTGVLAKQTANEMAGGTFSSRDEKWNNRVNEFMQSPIFGIGFASIDLNTAEGSAASTRSSGTIEPGSSWLAALSMTGIVGAIPFYFLVFRTLIKLIKRIREQNLFQYVVLTVLLIASIIHQFAEGYAFAGGSYLCFYFWLLLGACVSITSYENQTF